MLIICILSHCIVYIIVLHDVASKGKKKSSEKNTFEKSEYFSIPSIFFPETRTGIYL